MRTIEFRAWFFADKKYNEIYEMSLCGVMGWKIRYVTNRTEVKGYSFPETAVVFEHQYPADRTPDFVTPFVLEQFIGLYDDVTNKQIFEGDIVLINGEEIAEVRWLDLSCKFIANVDCGEIYSMDDLLTARVEVVGNIHTKSIEQARK